MTADAITALTFLKLKQVTIKESLDVGKHTLHRVFPCDSSTLVYMVSYDCDVL